MILGEINIDSFIKASKKFEQFRTHLTTEQEQAGAIQAFEYCYELAWKTMKRLLAQEGIVVNSPRETFRAAALQGYIKDPEIWFDFIKVRNISIHTYNEDYAQTVIQAFELFSAELQNLLPKLNASNLMQNINYCF